MHLVGTDLRLSPSDLFAFLGCRHRTGLDLAVVHGALAKPVQDDVLLQAMRDRGAAHERAYVESLRAEGLQIIEIDSNHPIGARAAATVQAMQDGAQVIVQAALVNGQWTGYADILRRVNTPSALGAWSLRTVRHEARARHAWRHHPPAGRLRRRCSLRSREFCPSSFTSSRRVRRQARASHPFLPLPRNRRLLSRLVRASSLKPSTWATSRFTREALPGTGRAL